ncbi:MAG TPA: ethanolamine ammonia-lyase subunit EutC [Stellaceae bacterium]|jgi:ethanolamine ammonia-lyase small subunit|nr:ethanolamine ammonia-lyase subunit EutC [Stellaceae bacterium]
MSEPGRPPHSSPAVSSPESSWSTLRQATPARIGLGRSGAGLPTKAHLDFQLAHARARDAVHAVFEPVRIAREVEADGHETVLLHSAAGDRLTYLRRPDLGRRLAAESRECLASRPAGRVDIVFVIADGLSATAVQAHAVPLLRACRARLDPALHIGPVAIVEGGRVAIGDEIGGILGADLAAVLIGERPGLSAADSLGVYVTWQPAPGTVDAARNCLSNIRPQGLPIAEAAERLSALLAAARRHRMTGVGLGKRLATAAARRVLERG